MRRIALVVVASMALALSCFAQTSESERPAASDNPKVGEESAESLIHREYRDALRKMETYFGEATASGVLTITQVPVEGDRKQSTYNFLYQFSDGASKWERNPGDVPPQPDGSGVSMVWCRNPQRYVFKLERPAGNSQFSIRSIAAKNSSRSDAMDGTAYRQLYASHAINGVPFSKLMDDSSFTILSAEYVTEDSEQLVHMEYDFLSPAEQPMLRGGELWLMPKQGWAIRKSRSDYHVHDRPSTPAGMTCEVEYSRFENGVAIPSRVQIEQRLGRHRIEEEFVFDKFTHGKSSPNDFTLTHYGLSEVDVAGPNTVVKSNKNTFWLFMINGALIISLIVAIALRRRFTSR